MTTTFDIILLASAGACALLSCALLAISLQRNWEKTSGGAYAPPAALLTRHSGWGLALLCFVLCVWRDGWSFTLLLWPLMMALGAAIVSTTLAYRRSWFLPLVNLLLAKS